MFEEELSDTEGVPDASITNEDFVGKVASLCLTGRPVFVLRANRQRRPLS